MFVNITRNKTNAAEARLQDMLFPTDDRFGLPTPVPKLTELAGMSAEEKLPERAQMIMQARAIQREAEDKAERMEQLIDDQLTQCNYRVARDVIHDACQISGDKGPVVMGRLQQCWHTRRRHQRLGNEKTFEPTVERIDPWDFSGYVVSHVGRFEFIFERKRLTSDSLKICPHVGVRPATSSAVARRVSRQRIRSKL